MTRILAALLLIFVCSSPVLAQDSPLALAESTSQEMLKALNANRAALQQNSDQIYDLVQEILLPHFDFTTMSRWVLGKHWRTATPDQRERFANDFRTLLVNTYSKALLEYSNEKIEFLPLSAAADSDDVTVRSEVHVRGQQPIPINYSMHRKDGAWKVYDVTIEGVSLVSNYRNTIDSQIRREGLDATLDKLRSGTLSTKG